MYDSSRWRRWHSPNTTTWSRHSRRIEPIRRSAYPFCHVDGFLCAVLSGANVIMPSEWMRWVWDSTEGKQSPEFTSEKQAQRILDLLMRHANDIAVTLTQFPQYYEPLFLERDHKGRTVSIVDEWCCGYAKGMTLRVG